MDYLVIVESSVTEGRALANIEEAKRLAPNKPIWYHVNSHHHSDHAAGVRAFIAEGSTIITQEMNKRFYEQIMLKSPRTLLSDRLSQSPKPASFVYVKDKYVFSASLARTILHQVSLAPITPLLGSASDS